MVALQQHRKIMIKLLNEYDVGLNPNDTIVSSILANKCYTDDIDAVSMVIKAYDLEQAKELYKLEFDKRFGLKLHSSEIIARR